MRVMHQVRVSVSNEVGVGGRVYSTITLPAIPGIDAVSDRRETMPTMPMIKGPMGQPQGIRGVARERYLRKRAETFIAALTEARLEVGMDL